MSFVLPASSVERLENIKEKAEWSSNTEAVKQALRLLEAMMEEVQNGSAFYVKRKGADEVPYHPFVIS